MNNLNANKGSDLSIEHCKIGILSLIFGMLLLVLIALSIGWAIYLETFSPGSISRYEIIPVFSGYIIVGCGMGSVVNAGISFYSIARKGRKHIYSYISLFISLILITMSILTISYVSLILS